VGDKEDYLMNKKGNIFNMHLGFVKKRKDVVLKEV
jgi:hypothetical protein